MGNGWWKDSKLDGSHRCDAPDPASFYPWATKTYIGHLVAIACLLAFPTASPPFADAWCCDPPPPRTDTSHRCISSGRFPFQGLCRPSESGDDIPDTSCFPAYELASCIARTFFVVSSASVAVGRPSQPPSHLLLVPLSPSVSSGRDPAVNSAWLTKCLFLGDCNL